MDSTEHAAHTTRVPAGTALTGLVLLALWLGWTLPVLWQQQRPAPRGHWSPEQILARVPAHLLARAGNDAAAVLLRGNPGCSCADPAPADPLLTEIGRTAALPFEWIVLGPGNRLVYAGPARLSDLCGGGRPSAVPLVTRLLALPQQAVVLSDRCSCPQE